MRLGICAFGAIVITTTATFAQDGRIAPDATARATDITTEIKTSGGLYHSDGTILLGEDKLAPLCPAFCAPRRVTSPDDATVGEREVMVVTMAAAALNPKLRVDSRRTTWARMEKLPGAATAGEATTAITRSEFRPALDPVLAEPTTEQAE
jgi:hypothetical protein